MYALIEVARLRDEIRKWILDQVLPGLIVYTLTAAVSAIGDKDAIEQYDAAASDGTEKAQRPVARTEPWGLRSVPVKGIRGAAFKFGTSNVIFFGIAPTQKYGPQDLTEGETALYSAEVERGMHLDKNGQNNVNAKSGQDVVVNGGTANVARKGDKVIADANMATFITNVATALSLAPPTDFGVINEGADHFKG